MMEYIPFVIVTAVVAVIFLLAWRMDWLSDYSCR